MSTPWYFCLNHMRAEQEPDGPVSDCLGPYASEAEAAGALQRAAERNEAWDNDPNWKDD
jgi:hypothetical protein